MAVEGTAWYAVAVGSAFALLVVIRIPGVFGLRVDRIRWLWQVRYPVCQRAIPWLSTAHVCFLAACVAGNVLSIVLSSDSVDDIARKSAVAASINLVPVFAIGSTGSIAGYLGLSTETSVFLHGCFGGLSIGCGMSHFIILTQISRGSTRTVVSGAMTAAFLTSFLIIFVVEGVVKPQSRWRGALRWVHRLVAVSTAGFLLWHVLSLPFHWPYFTPTLAVLLWGFRAIKGFHRAWQLGLASEIDDLVNVNDGYLCKVSTEVPVRPYPGCYFYIYFHHVAILDRFYGFATPLYSWEPILHGMGDRETSHGIGDPEKEETTRLQFLVDSRFLEKYRTSRVSMAGPYGRNIHVERFETVLLIAEGMGIVGIIPFALDLARRKSYRESWRPSRRPEDLTLQVALIWKLDHPKQEELASTQLSCLMDLDQEVKLLIADFYYPDNSPGAITIPEALEKKWRQVLYSAETKRTYEEFCQRNIQRIIEKGSTKPGRCAVVVCGSNRFAQELQKTVGRLDNPTKFFKIESPPHLSNHSKRKSETKLPLDSRMPARALRKFESLEKPQALIHKLTDRVPQTKERAGRKRAVVTEEIQVVRDFPNRI